MARIRYLGISFFEIVADDGTVVYMDPCIGINKYCPITLDDIQRADLVLVSHRARDHGPDAIPILQKTGALMACPRDMCWAAKQQGIPGTQVEVMVSGMTLARGGVRVKCVRSEHGSFSEFEGRPLFDLALGYIVYVRDGVGIYHLGDTSIISDFALFGKLYKPKVMCAPIGMGIWPTGGIEMDPFEAAIATGMVGPEFVIPVHFDHVKQADSLEQFAEHLKVEAPNTQLKWLKPGESMDV